MQSSSSSSSSLLGQLSVEFQAVGSWTEHGLLMVNRNSGGFSKGSYVVHLDDRLWSSFHSQREVNDFIRGRVFGHVFCFDDRKSFVENQKTEINRVSLIDMKKRSVIGKSKDFVRVSKLDNRLTKSSAVEQFKVQSVSKVEVSEDEDVRLSGDDDSDNRAHVDVCRMLKRERKKERNRKRKLRQNMNSEQIKRDRKRKKRVNMSESDVESDRKRKKRVNMSESDVESDRKRKRHENMSESDIESHRKRSRHENMSESDIESHRKRSRHENMSESDIESHRKRNRHDNMTSKNIDNHLFRNRLVGMQVEGVIRQHNSKLLENLTLEQVTTQRNKRRIIDMSQHQREDQNLRNRKAQYRANHKRLLELKRITALKERTDIVMARRDKLTVKSLSLTWNKLCPHCRFTYLSSVDKARRNLCCDNGKMLKLPQYRFRTISDTMVNLINNNLEHLNRNSLYYNSILSLGCTMVDNKDDPVDPQKWVRMNGPHAVKIHGTTRHFLPNTSRVRSGIEYFTFHSSEALSLEDVPEKIIRDIDDGLLAEIKDELLDINTWMKDCRIVGDYLNTNENQNNDTDSENEESNNNNPTDELLCHELSQRTCKFDVGAITSNIRSGNRCVVYKPKNDEAWRKDSALSENMEPLCYPLLFHEGESGWGYFRDRKTVNLQTYLRHKLLSPENLENGNQWMITNHYNVDIPTNREQVLSKLGQTFNVDNVCRYVDFALKFQQRNQSIYFGKKSNDNDEDNSGDDETEQHHDQLPPQQQQQQQHNLETPLENESNTRGPSPKEKVFLGDSIHGSKRHLSKCSQNGLRIVAEYGPPTFFLTCTCDPQWPEILERMGSHQTAYDRPDVVDMVFHEKLNLLLNNLKTGVYTEGEVPIYIIYVIEWQERGLPHVHIVLRLTNHPHKYNETEYIDKFVCAERSPISDDDDEET